MLHVWLEDAPPIQSTMKAMVYFMREYICFREFICFSDIIHRSAATGADFIYGQSGSGHTHQLNFQRRHLASGPSPPGPPKKEKKKKKKKREKRKKRERKEKKEKKERREL